MSPGLIRGEDVGIYKDNGHDWDFRLTIVDLVAQTHVRAKCISRKERKGGNPKAANN